MPLTAAKLAFKPLEYPWAYDAWKLQQQLHWMPDEVPMGDDVKDWTNKLTDAERNLLTQIFRFFTQADVEVQDNYMERYARVFKPTEIKMMLAAFANMETVHIAAYALLLETIGMPDVEFLAFLDYQAMRDKHDFAATFNVDNPHEVAKTLAAFGAGMEGLQLFASFAMLMNFPRRNRMKGMGQIVSWSVRDETLHCANVIRLYHQWLREHPEIDQAVIGRDVTDIIMRMVKDEDAFIDLAFEMGDIEGLTKAEMKRFIRFIADQRLQQLGLSPVYGIRENPLPWFDQLTGGVELANFFEARSTEYSKAATQGEWDDTVYA
jgi:ribonucleoside-diphosphate reductase beta chain